jgi:hypothetical protein
MARLDLFANLLERARHRARCEQRGCHGALARFPRRPFAVDQRFAIVAIVGIVRLPEVEVMAEPPKAAFLDRIAGRVADAIGDDQQVAAVFGQQFIGLDRKRLRRGVPEDLVDPDAIAEAAQRQGVARLIR